MQCLLCLEYQQDESKCIPVNSTQLNIKSLIDKHLWPIETFTSTSWICSTCLEELSDFHKFYTRIKEAHYYDNLVLKIEPDPLLEPEVIIRQNFDGAPIKIKTEREEEPEPDDSQTFDDSIDMFGDDQNNQDNSDSDEDGNDSDDNLLQIRKVVSSKKTKLKRENGKDGDNVEEEKPAEKRKRSPRTKNTTSGAIGNSTRKSSNLPEINCVENDKFLNEHFKMTCDKCQQTFERFRQLCQHYSKEHKEQGYALCCGTKFLKRQLLVDHINFHLNPEYFKCEFCGKVFTKRVCLSNHVKIHDEKKFDCDMCGKKFVLKHKLDKHKLTHIPESEKKFPCNECGKFYANENILTQHQKAVHLNFYARVCEICGETLPDHPTYKKHMERHEGKPPETVKCDQCGLILKGQRCYKIHLELKHPVGEKIDYNCHICSKVSPSMIALKKHIREAHEMGYRFKCTICEKEFKRADNFKSHMAIHTGTPLHRCPWCPKEFNSNGNMHQHRKKAHPVEWEEEQRKKYSGNLPPNN